MSYAALRSFSCLFLEIIMATVLNFSEDNPIFVGKKLRAERENSTLSLAQAAAAIGISPITLDGWEQGRKPQISSHDAALKYSEYRINTNYCHKHGNNLIFGVFPICIAKNILDVSTKEMAEMCGYSLSSWTKMEANHRILPDDKLKDIERWVNSAWNAACSNQSNNPGP
jgi:DNA-binding XRE family transcriptional regulator